MTHLKDKGKEADGFVWRCRRCFKKISLRADSFWWSLRKPLNISLMVLYLFARDVQLCIAEALLLGAIDDCTLSDYFNLYRDLMSRDMVDNPVLLGSPGVIVQIDESKFGGKRKGNKGRLVKDGVWVFGLLDTNTKKAALFQVADRTERTLCRHIQDYVADGTTIHSDGWAAYGGIARLPNNYTHFVVNHKENYVDPITGAHTQEIENLWTHSKQPWKRSRGFAESMRIPYLDEFVWRWNNKYCNRYVRLLQLIARYYPCYNFPLSAEILATKPAIRQ
jgi:hypothetical protein